ncbi:hypothetical protein GCM10025876_08760 [Demequina litorisediminis]|uniref:Membrane transport protein MMPL domain-containing protein n=1 Tax=Demequina litorisediminis TaxID=1849022 RepID=A0ABQ6ICF1_9MICO|nr:hypothetical protein GCM10025876_08760 [Demequina litorisediminis]
MANFLFRLGRGSARRPFIAIVAWLVALAAAAGSFLAFGGTLTDSFSIPGTETDRVANQLTEEIPDAGGTTARIVYQTQDDSELTEAQQQQISDSLATVGEFDFVTAVIDPFETAQQAQDQAAQIEDGRTQIADAKAELDSGQEQARRRARRGRVRPGSGSTRPRPRLDAAIQQAKDAGQYDAAQAQFDAQQATIDTQQEQIDAGLAQITEQQAQIDAGREELATQEQQ